MVDESPGVSPTARVRGRGRADDVGHPVGLSEADTRAKLIDPAIHARGWTEDLDAKYRAEIPLKRVSIPEPAEEAGEV